ncbi:hypothetical protein TVAG_375310 [Trichomonas vaginalis G3]|uniref:DUF3447 domain-containing protein n=1 Tax=Trichomonas vaginalis (strain ATCC PRA-98 / G3) TaxID=412133 RepID=A2FH09_TRIV3|nr:protein ubiquitination [Trichomonas vaginalis G3]EAX95822.1 hypothetical protein TVAG_375310 [Trichomonas vaginalis G3]KAI5500556.1 protein ubiquitination [Trichomonas vaginalis G3]|eukprot:XP_001308752.1 hypothetical protein [Trichomonas vaginalis G3]
MSQTQELILDPSIIPTELSELHSIEEDLVHLDTENIEQIFDNLKNLDNDMINYVKSCILHLSTQFRLKWGVFSEISKKLQINYFGDSRYPFSKYMSSIQKNEDVRAYDEVLSEDSPISAIINNDFSKLVEFSVDPKFSEAEVMNVISLPNLNLLDLSAYVGNLEIYQYLKLNGMEPTTNTMENAIIGGNLEICQICHDQIKTVTEAQIIAAIKCHRYEILQWFIDEFTPNVVYLSLSINSYSTLLFSYFIQKNGGVNSYIATNLLIDAYNTNNTSLLSYLIKNGADVNRKFGSEEETLLIRATRDNKSFVKLLIDSGANTEITNPNGLTPLLITAMTGNIEIARILIEGGANSNVTNSSGQNLIQIAENFGNTEYVQQFKKQQEYQICNIA